MSSKLVSMADVRKNAAKNPNGGWVVVKGKVYDFTDFVKNHPGGAELITKNNGKDATAEFEASHPEDIIERTITPEEYKKMYIGDIDPKSMNDDDKAKFDPDAEEEEAAGQLLGQQFFFARYHPIWVHATINVAALFSSMSSCVCGTGTDAVVMHYYYCILRSLRWLQS